MTAEYWNGGCVHGPVAHLAPLIEEGKNLHRAGGHRQEDGSCEEEAHRIAIEV